MVEVYGNCFGLSRDFWYLFCVEKQGLAMRLEAGGGSVAALLRNHPIFLSSYSARGHLGGYFRQTSPVRLV
jgi:hypothetical protein